MLGPAVSEQFKQLLKLDTNGPAEGSYGPLFGLDAEALAERMAAIGEPRWRGRQLTEAMYRQRVADLDAI